MLRNHESKEMRRHITIFKLIMVNQMFTLISIIVEIKEVRLIFVVYIFIDLSHPTGFKWAARRQKIIRIRDEWKEKGGQYSSMSSCTTDRRQCIIVNVYKLFGILSYGG